MIMIMRIKLIIELGYSLAIPPFAMEIHFSFQKAHVHHVFFHHGPTWTILYSYAEYLEGTAQK